MPRQILARINHVDDRIAVTYDDEGVVAPRGGVHPIYAVASIATLEF